MRNLLIASIILILVAAGCVEDPQLTDQDYIRELLEQSSLVDPDALDGKGEDQDGRSVESPEAWWREITAEGPLQIVLENDPSVGVCTVTVCRSLLGDFNIDIVHDGVLDPGIKSIHDVATRRVIVMKLEAGGSGPHGGWVLTHITPVEFSLASGYEQEVFVQSMRLYEGEELIWECTDPTTFYDVETELPGLEEGTLVRAEAELLHNSPQYDPEFFVYVHGPCPVWPRHQMFDNGSYGDRVAGDGTYSYEWYVEDTPERWHFAIDVIDADTMEDQLEQDYDSGAWGIRVRRVGY
jgi:hypothetical protein